MNIQKRLSAKTEREAEIFFPYPMASGFDDELQMRRGIYKLGAAPRDQVILKLAKALNRIQNNINDPSIPSEIIADMAIVSLEKWLEEK